MTSNHHLYNNKVPYINEFTSRTAKRSNNKLVAVENDTVCAQAGSIP